MKKYLVLVNFLFVFIFTLVLFPQVLAADDTVDAVKSPFSKEAQDRKAKEHSTKEFVTHCQNEGLESDKCREGLDIAFKTLKPLLIQRLDKVCTHIDNMVNRASTKNTLTDEEKDALSNVLSDCTEFVGEYKELLQNAESIDDLRNIAASFSTQKDFANRVKKISANKDRVHVINIKRILEKLEAFIVRVENHIELSSEVGHDTSEVTAYVSSAKSNLITVKGLIENDSVNKADFDEIRTNLKEAHSSLKSAVEILKGFYKETPWEVK